jgi:hypothetical protein
VSEPDVLDRFEFTARICLYCLVPGRLRADHTARYSGAVWRLCLRSDGADDAEFTVMPGNVDLSGPANLRRDAKLSRVPMHDGWCAYMPRYRDVSADGKLSRLRDLHGNSFMPREPVVPRRLLLPRGTDMPVDSLMLAISELSGILHMQ